MILSIESSCDDSSIAITKIETKKLIFHKKISQDDQHSVYGGVVPELAARLHAEALPKILEEINPFFSNIKAVAITNEPGLSVTLVEGVAMAKAISLSLNIPLIEVNHLMGHIYSLFIEKEEIFPQSVLLVSGGHTQIFEILDHSDIKTIAKTMDDSFGESFDKVAKMLGLGYPGGGIVEGLAREGDEKSYDFTVPLSNSPLLSFSYSGLKNQVRMACDEILKTRKEGLNQQEKNNICASFQRVAVEHLIQKIKKYFKQNRPTNFAIVGGASQNLYLRKKMEILCGEFNVKLSLAAVEFCSDNAAMIGRLGVKYFELGKFIKLEDLGINPTSSI